MLIVWGDGEEALGHERLAESRRGFCHRDRGQVVKDPLAPGGQNGVDPVAELMRHGDDILGATRLVEKDVWMRARHHRMAKRPAAFSLHGWCIDPPLVEESRSRSHRLGARTARRYRSPDPARRGSSTTRPLGDQRRHQVVVGQALKPRIRAFSWYQRCGMSNRPRTASISALTDSSDASLSRLRLASQWGYERSRSSIAFSYIRVLKTKALVRRLDAKPARQRVAGPETAGSNRSGCASRLTAASTVTGSPLEINLHGRGQTH